jgi:hypothetical protein
MRFYTNSGGGNGTTTEKFRIFSDGNVLIQSGGTFTNAGFKLDVNGTGRFSGNLTTNGNFIGRTSNGQAFAVGNAVDSDLGIFVQTNNILFSNSGASSGFSFAIGGTTRFSIASTGAATFSSSVTATSFFESPDATLKTLVEDYYQAKGIESVIAKLYIKNGKQELGYYAQDLEGVLPSAVSKGSDGLLNLSYREVHTAKIAYLEQKIKQLENELGRFSK